MTEDYVNEDFTPDERALLEPHVTNLEGPVFALINLPEAVKGGDTSKRGRFGASRPGASAGSLPAGFAGAAFFTSSSLSTRDTSSSFWPPFVWVTSSVANACID